MTKGFTNVRSGKHLWTRVIGMKGRCIMVRARREGKWLRLLDEPGYLLINTPHGPLVQESPVTYELVASGSCSEAGLHPIHDPPTCEAAALGLGLPDVTLQESSDNGRPEGCYFLGGSLWLATSPANSGNGASGGRKPICASQAAEQQDPCSRARAFSSRSTGTTSKRPAEDLTKSAEEDLEDLKHLEDLLDSEEAGSEGPGEAGSEEPGAAGPSSAPAPGPAAQAPASPSGEGELPADSLTPTDPLTLFCFCIVRMSGRAPELLKAQFENRASIFRCEEYSVFTVGGKMILGQGWKTTEIEGSNHSELSLPTYLAAWRSILRSALFLRQAWTVKVEVGVVFFPDRLRHHLRTVHASEGSSQLVLNCNRNSGEPTLLPSVEVLSREAVAAFGGGLDRCMEHRAWMDFPEEKFMQRCLQLLGVGSLFDGDQVGDERCWSAPCSDTSKAAFASYGQADRFLRCWEEANDVELSSRWPLDTVNAKKKL